MSNSTTTAEPENCDTATGLGTTVAFSNISEPGCYVCNWSGHLLRVPKDGFAFGRAPLANLVGSEPLFVTKISDNPYIPITKAKLLACNFDLHVTF